MADWKSILVGGVKNELEVAQVTSRYSRLTPSVRNNIVVVFRGESRTYLTAVRHSTRAHGSGNEIYSKKTNEWKRFILEDRWNKTPLDISPEESLELGRGGRKSKAQKPLRKVHIRKRSSSRTFSATRLRIVSKDDEPLSSSSEHGDRYIELEKAVRSRARLDGETEESRGTSLRETYRLIAQHLRTSITALEQRVSEAETELVSKFRASEAQTMKSLKTSEDDQDSLMREVQRDLLSMENADKLLNEIVELRQVVEHRLEEAVSHELRKARELLSNEDRKLQESLLSISRKFQEKIIRSVRRKNALAGAALLLEETQNFVHFEDGGGHLAPAAGEKPSTLSRTKMSGMESNKRP